MSSLASIHSATETRLAGALSPRVERLLKRTELLQSSVLSHSGPVHLLLPQELSRNAEDFRRVVEEFDVDYRLYLAHKPTKSHALIREARRSGLGIDVASTQELVSALSVGYTGADIECTGAKSIEFLELALLHGCLISVDSIGELKRITELHQALRLERSVRVLLRVTDVPIPGRTVRGRTSRFGIPAAIIGEAFRLLRANPAALSLVGFHIHNDRRDSSDRAGQIEGVLSLVVDAFHLGFQPTIVNIGGGFRRPVLEDASAWPRFVGHLEEELVHGRALPLAGAFSYGLNLNDRGKIIGRTKALAFGAMPDFTRVLKELLSAPFRSSGTIAEFIADNELSLMFEPGAALLDQCGISLFEVVDVKRGGGGKLYAAVAGNFYNIAAQYREYIPDPLLIPRSPRGAAEEPCFIVGNLCREEDFLMKRLVTFKQTPAPGDIICFTNTAAYRADFEDASPHQHPRGVRLAAYENEGNWQICTEERSLDFS